MNNDGVNIVLIVVIIILTLKNIQRKITLKFLEEYLKKIDKYPTSEDVDTYTKKYLKKLFNISKM